MPTLIEKRFKYAKWAVKGSNLCLCDRTLNALPTKLTARVYFHFFTAIEAIRVPANTDLCYSCEECCNEPHFILWGDNPSLRKYIDYHGQSEEFNYQVILCAYCFYELDLDTKSDIDGLLLVIHNKR
jgi:hypothetical protein